MLLNKGETDYHCHILPGLDDGPSEKEASIEMAAILAQAGYREVYCTPHLIKGIYEASTEQVLHERELLQRELDIAGIGIKLLAGREYYLDEFLLDLIRQPLLLEGTNWIMIEIPAHTSVDLVKDTLFEVKRSGYTPFIAHPERCRLLEMPDKESKRESALKAWLSRISDEKHGNESGNELLGYLIKLGCQFQANLGSRKGMYGGRVKTNARYLETNGTYTHAGTDAHSPDAAREILGFR
ncbi:MAG: phosphoesterase [Chlorobiaceae bacterium]|nr:phosphoesterase [Chlorobiaceae bacterium]